MPKTRTGSNIVQVKNHNRQAILQSLLQAPMSRVERANKLAISSMTATNLVRELTDDGLITAVAPPDTAKSVGRPRTTLQIKADAGYTIGIQMGIGIYWITLVDLHGRVIRKDEHRFDIQQDATAVLATITEQIQAFKQQVIDSCCPILGIGFGASGLVNKETGVNLYAPSLGWHNVPIKAQLEEATDLPVFVENNVRAMALAEAYFGAGKTADSLAFVFGRIGVGAGIVLNGRLWRGPQDGAGEIGHTIIIPYGGDQCSCGQTGCLETLVTQPILIKQVQELDQASISIDYTQSDHQIYEAILNHARAGHAEINQLIQTMARYLGLAIANLINTLNPEIIFLGGMYAQGADLFVPLVQETVKQRAFGRLGEHANIQATSFGLEAGQVGASCAALVQFFYKQYDEKVITS